MDELSRLTPLAVLCIQGLFAWALWTLRKAFVRGEEFLLHVERDARKNLEITTRMQAIESRIAQLPDPKDLAKLSTALEALRGDIKALDARITGVDNLVERLERILAPHECRVPGCRGGQ